MRDYANQGDLTLNREITANFNGRNVSVIRSNDNNIPNHELMGSGSDGENSPIHQDEGKKVNG